MLDSSLALAGGLLQEDLPCRANRSGTVLTFLSVLLGLASALLVSLVAGVRCWGSRSSPFHEPVITIARRPPIEPSRPWQLQPAKANRFTPLAAGGSHVVAVSGDGPASASLVATVHRLRRRPLMLPPPRGRAREDPLMLPAPRADSVIETDMSMVHVPDGQTTTSLVVLPTDASASLMLAPPNDQMHLAENVYNMENDKCDDPQSAIKSYFSSENGQVALQQAEQLTLTPVVVNDILKSMWPCISEYVIHLITAVLEPALKKVLGSFGEGFSFDKEKIHLGGQPCRFRGMRARRTVQRTTEGTIQNLVLQGDVEWQGDPLLYINQELGKWFRAARVGIEKVTIRGELIVELVGIKPRPYFFEGLRAFFVNPPTVDLNFTGTWRNVLEYVPGNLLYNLKRSLLDVIDEQIANRVVVPNRLGIKFDADADVFRVLKPRPVGVLTLGVKRAEGLGGLRDQWFAPGTLAPYIVGHCGAEKFRSPTPSDAKNPNLDFQVRLVIASPMQQSIHMAIFDDPSSRFLGQLDLPVAEMLAWGEGEFPFELADRDGKKGQNGRLWLTAEWRPLLLDPAAAHTDNVGLVFAGVYYASRVPFGVKDSEYWVTARCEGGQVQTQMSHRVEQVQDTSSPSAETARQQQLLKKLEVLQTYQVRAEDMAEILEVDAAELPELQQILENRTAYQRQGHEVSDQPRLTGAQTLHWDHAFEFITEKATDALVTLELKAGKAASIVERLLGTYEFAVSDLLKSPTLTITRTVQLPGTHVYLKVCYQLRFLGMPKVVPRGRETVIELDDQALTPEHSGV